MPITERPGSNSRKPRHVVSDRRGPICSMRPGEEQETHTLRHLETQLSAAAAAWLRKWGFASERRLNKADAARAFQEAFPARPVVARPTYTCPIIAKHIGIMFIAQWIERREREAVCT